MRETYRHSYSAYRASLLTLLFVLCVPSLASAQSTNAVKQLERAASLVRDKRIAEAEQIITSVLKTTPKEAGALSLLGTIRAQQGNLDEAERLFLRAVESDNKFIAPRMNLAYLYLLKRTPERAITELREVIRLDPQNRDATIKLAQLLSASDRPDEVISLVERMKQEQPTPVPLLISLGDAYLKKNNYALAEENYLLASNEERDNLDLALGIAQSAFGKGDVIAAGRHLSRAKELAAASHDNLYRFAVVALKINRDGEAMDALQRAIELKPDESSYHLLQGIAWLRKPELFEAEKSFRQFLKLQPDNPQGQMFLGYALLKQKRSPEARTLLEKSINANTTLPEPFYYLGLIAQEQKEDTRAVELLEQAVRLLPTYAHARTALGASYLRLKNYPRAQQELELAVKLNPEDSKAHYNLALLYTRLKDQPRAQAQMRIVEQLKTANKPEANENEILAPSSPTPR